MPSFKLSELDGLEAWLKQKTASGLRRGLTSAAFRTLGVIQNEIIPAESPQPVDTGAYRAGWRVETTERGADIVNDLPQAGVIERGARPENIKVGTAMIKALAEWAQRKGFSPPPYSPAGGVGRNPYEAVAWGIAMGMKKRGVFNRGGKQGLRVAEKAVAKLKGFLQDEVNREMKR